MVHKIVLVFAFCSALFFPMVTTLHAEETTDCQKCHDKITPGIVKDFNRGAMASEVSCSDCHGIEHKGETDVEKAQLPTIETCEACHSKKAERYLSGKHAMGLVAIEAMPYTHMQPKSFVEGQKGCGGCHTLGLKVQKDRATESRKYYRYGMDCQNCHTRHAFSKKEAAEPEACKTCHMGFDHAQWEMYTGAKHGVAYLINRDIDPDKKDRAPRCQTCHMPGGDHRVFSAWGFLAARLPEEDKEWMGYRTTILKALGVLDPNGQPTPRLDIVKAGKVARLSKEEFQAERKRFIDVCRQCHTPNFVNENMKNADLMIKEADKIFSESIEIVSGLYQDGIIEKKGNQPAYPDLLAFYDVDTKIEQILYEMFMDHRMKTFQGAFHMNYDYSTWYGYAKMKKDLVEIKELAQKMRNEQKMKND